MTATYSIARAQDVLMETAGTGVDVYAVLDAYVAEHGIDTDTPIDTDVLTADDVAAIRRTLTR